MILGIDASNLRDGGGVTHLIEFLNGMNSLVNEFSRVYIWGGKSTLNRLTDRSWLSKVHLPILDKKLPFRIFWQKFRLSKLAKEVHCEVLFIPGSLYLGNFKPVVTMSRNMLPFELTELKRYGLSSVSIRLLFLRWMQTYSFKRVDGLIFLSQYACGSVIRVTGKISGKTCTIPHGLNPRFLQAPKKQSSINEYSEEKPFRILYVSIIDYYKHQWKVVEAVSLLREKGFPVELELVGPSYPPALKRVKKAKLKSNDNGTWVHYHGSIPFEELHLIYLQAELGLFASSCENMPNILLETMASGLPIACSNRGPMPEVLGETGVYFDPEKSLDIARAIQELIDSPQLREDLAHASYKRAQQFSWQRCANETFGFLKDVNSQKDSTCAVL
ncbi:MAG: hypothetical protein COA79_11420 [Planctomycetota bacterium]|nr:MAG: hypothetical protein COA79_11420 [Planctomycetota bacterium]